MRGQRPPKFKDELSIPLLSAKLEDLTGVSVLQSQRRRRWGTRCQLTLHVVGMPNELQ